MRTEYRKKQRKIDTGQKIVLSLSLCLFLGIIAGAVYALIFPATSVQKLEGQIYGHMYGSAFYGLQAFDDLKTALIKYGKTLVIIWSLAFMTVGMVFIYGVLFTKGASLGFTIAFFIRIYGLDGLIACLRLFTVQNLILLPTIVFVAQSGVRFIYENITPKRGTEEEGKRQVYLTEYFFVLLIGIACVVLVSFYEAYAAPAFIYLLDLKY